MEDYNKQLEKQQIEILKKAAALKFMTKKARERLNRVRMVKPETAEKIQFAIIQAVQSGQIKEKINESQLIGILKEVNQNQNKQYKIIR